MSATIIKSKKQHIPRPTTAPSDAVRKYSEALPWYKQLVEDVRETLVARDRHAGGYRAHKDPY